MSHSASVQVRNRQRVRRIDVRLLRRITQRLLAGLLGRGQCELVIYLVGDQAMTALNEKFLQHAGTTDVITFDYADPARPGFLCGEIFICVDEARAQADRFRTTWQSEVVRYVVHAILHLCGYDDLASAARRKMKQQENRFLRRLAGEFELLKLEKSGRQGRV